MNLPQFYVIAGLISWQPFIRQNDKGFEALVEIIFLCCLVNTGESGWTGTVVILIDLESTLDRHPAY